MTREDSVNFFIDLNVREDEIVIDETQQKIVDMTQTFRSQVDSASFSSQSSMQSSQIASFSSQSETSLQTMFIAKLKVRLQLVNEQEKKNNLIVAIKTQKNRRNDDLTTIIKNSSFDDDIVYFIVDKFQLQVKKY